MSNYTQSTFFTPKDSLITGDPLKLIKGSEVDPELAAISTAIGTKVDTAGVALEKVSTTLNITTAALSEVTIADADRLMFQDVSDSDSMVVATYAQFITAIEASANHDSLVGFVADEHIAHSGVIPTASDGVGITLSGTGIEAAFDYHLDIPSLAADASILAADSLAYYDAVAVAHKEITYAQLITALETDLDHDAITGFVADEHVAHTGVTITAGSGLSYSAGGTDISASATLDVDITELTEQIILDETLDFFMFYDASGVANKKIPAENVAGTELGDGHWYRSSAYTITTEATLVYDTAEYDVLTRGTFSVSTGQYTRGSAAGRIWVSARSGAAAMDDDDSIELEVQVNSVTKLRHYQWNDTENDTPEVHVFAQGALNLAAGDIVRVRVTSSSSEGGVTGTSNAYISIQELS
jgi:hypothetical protein